MPSEAQLAHEIMPFRLTDLPAILQLEGHAFSEDAFGLSTFLSLYWRGRDTFVVARTAAGLIGYLSAYLDASLGYIASIAVIEAARGQGVGVALMRHIHGLFQAKGAVGMALHVRTINTAAIGLYQKLGYTVEATLEGYYADGGTAYLMRLPFASA